MSLIYDALRAPPSADTPAPSYGSVSSGGRLSVPRLRRGRMLGFAGVAGGLGLLALAWPLGGTAPEAVRDPLQVAVGEPEQAGARAQAEAVPAVTLAPAVVRVAIVEPAPAAAPASASTLTAAPAPAPAPIPTTIAAPAPAPVRSAAVAPPAAAARSLAPAPAPAAVAKVVAPAAALPAASTPRPSAAPVREMPQEAARVETARADVGEALIRFNALVARDEFDEAAGVLEALRAEGLNPLAHSRLLGYLSLRAGRLDEARRAYTQVLSRLPDDREASINLALVELGQGHAGEAGQRLRKLAEQRPDDNRVRALLAQARSQGRAQ